MNKRLTLITVPLLFVAMISVASDSEEPSLFLDYLKEPGELIQLLLNPADYSNEWLEMPMSGLTKGDSVWIASSTEIVKAKFESIMVKKKYNMQGGITVEFSLKKPIKSGYIVVSLNPLPKRKWTLLKLTDFDKAFVKEDTYQGPNSFVFPPIKIKSDEIGEFLLVNEEIKGEHEFVQFRTILYEMGKERRWSKLTEFEGQGVVPIVDVDGDGFPEVAGATGYKSFILRRIYPTYKELTINTSGV